MTVSEARTLIASYIELVGTDNGTRSRNGGVTPAIAGEADDGPPLTPIVGGIAAANSRESTHVGWVVGGGEYPRPFA